MTDLLLPFLRDKNNEMMRAAAADALAAIGDPAQSAAAIEEALAGETFAWPAARMRAALDFLRAEARKGRP
jgi:hypothetical protein